LRRHRDRSLHPCPRRLLEPKVDNLSLPYGRAAAANDSPEYRSVNTSLPKDAPSQLSGAHLVAAAATLIARVTGEDFPGDMLVLYTTDANPKAGTLLRIPVNLDEHTPSTLIEHVRKQMHFNTNMDVPTSTCISDIRKAVKESGAHSPELHVHEGTSPDAYESGVALVFAADTRSGQLLFLYEASRMFIRDEYAANHVKEHYNALLKTFMNQPDVPVGQTSILHGEERELVTEKWMGSQSKLPKAGVHHLFESTAAKVPNNIAMRHANEKWTYKELNEWSNRLARKLRSMGASRNTLVGVLLNRQAELLPSILGVLKVGAAFVPLDPMYPRDRISMMLEDSVCGIVVTSSSLVESVRAAAPYAKVIRVDGDAASLQAEGSSNLECAPNWTPEDLCYVIFTSGSTGRPKGVMIRHRSWVNLLQSFARLTGINEEDTLLAVTTVCFDIAGLELGMPLLVGGCVHVAKKEEASDVERLLPLVRKGSHVTFMQATPATWRMLFNGEWEGNNDLTVLCGGEPLPPELATQLSNSCKRLWNVYGPTETTIWSTCSEIGPNHQGVVSIGKPIDNTTVYILDSRQKLMPVGVPGELWIGGLGLSPGYLGRKDLTKERFVPSPFREGEYMYKTGDLAKWRSDGSLECLGRLDHQVKIRGFRIELGEIESVLDQQPRVNQAVVDAQSMPGSHDNNEEKQLVAFVVPRQVEEEDESEKEVQQQQEETAEKAGDGGHDLEEALQWGAIYDSAYATENAVNDDPTLNFSGYDNSYTPRVPHKQETIKEWVERTCERINSLKPRRALEQGCGNGMILLRCAAEKGVDRYLGADLSEQAVSYCQEVLKQPRFRMSHVSVHVGGAHESEKFNKEMLDTNVCNGVSMYFPSADYLAEVIRSSLKSVVPGGTFFLGDVRNACLLQHFHLSVAQFQATEDTPFSKVLATARKSAAYEKEFLVDPELFLRLQDALSDVAVLSMDVKRGIYHTEFAMFRYDVTIKKKGPQVPSKDRISYDFEHFDNKSHTLHNIRRRLQSNKPKTLAITGIADARIAEEREMMEIMNQEELPETVADFRKQMQRGVEAEPGIEPENLYVLGQELGYTVEIFWCPENQTRIDVLFVNQPYLGGYMPLCQMTYKRVLKEREAKDWSAYTSKGNKHYADIGGTAGDRLNAADVAKLRVALRDRVPEYMVPKLFVSLEKMPTTQNGKVDRKALPKPSALDIEASAAREGEYQPPEGETEQKLAKLWSELLRTPEISADDDFFELGGQSLLAMQLASKVKQEMGCNVGLTQITNSSGLREMAALIDGGGGDDSGKSAEGDAPLADVRIVQKSEMPYNVSNVPNTFITISDGCRLAAKMWLPDQEGKYPAVLEVQPYRKNDGTQEIDAITFPYIAGSGFACLRIDSRGSGDSEGDIADEYTRRQQLDAYEVVQWAASQPWCDGNVSIMGVSWGGFIALQAAALQPPNLKSIIACVATDDRFEDDMHYKGGSLLEENMTWGCWMLHTASQPPDPANVGQDKWLSAWKQRLAGLAPAHSRWMQHTSKEDAFWRNGSVANSYNDINVPAFIVGASNGGGYHNAVPRLARNLSNAPVRSLLGPWSHNYPHATPLGPQHGFLQDTVDFLSATLYGKEPMQQQFCAYAARPVIGEPSSQPGVVPGRWLQGSSVQEVESQAQPTEYVFAGGSGLMRNTAGKETGSQAIAGGAMDAAEKVAKGDTSARPVGVASNRWFTFGNGPDMPVNQKDDDGRSTSFTAVAHEDATLIVGRPTVKLTVGSGSKAAGGQVIARLNAVSSDGTSHRISYGVGRIDGKKEMEIQMDYTCFEVPAGYKLRVALSKDLWPIVWPSQHSGEELHLALGASSIVLPLVESSKVESMFKAGESVARSEVHLSQPLQPQQVRAGAQKRNAHLEDSAVVVERTDDAGGKKLPSNLVLDSTTTDKFALSTKDGPVHKVEWRTVLARESHFSAEAKLWASMARSKSDPTKARLETTVEASANDELVFSRQWSDVVQIAQ
jgi:putative CocE/NonD family hydrolase